MVEADTWICGNCRSINSARATSCYSCRAPHTLRLDPTSPTPSAPPKLVRDEAPLEDRLEIARRAGATWLPTDRRAWLARVMVAVVSVVSLAKIGFDVWTLRQEQVAPAGDATTVVDPLVGLAVWALVIAAWGAGVAAWGAWLSRVVANVPALGGGFPGTSPGAAFLASVIPIANLVWGTAVLRDVLVRLSPKDGVRFGLLTAWWIATVLALLPWVGKIPGQTAVIRIALRVVAGSISAVLTAITGSGIGAAEMAEVFAGILLLLAAGLAIWLIDQVEDLQESRRTQLGIAAEGAPAAA